MDDEIEILKALQTAAIAAVAASTLPDLPIKAIGRVFDIKTKAPDGKYLELLHFPNNIQSEFWGKEKTYRGMFRLMLHWPLDDQGAYPPMTILKSIAAYFEKGKTLRSGQISVQIYEVPDFSGPVDASPESLYPVSIRYQRFAA